MAKKGRPLSFQREEVLDKALRLFWHKGFESISTDDVCRETGLSKPSLYHSFGSKEDLYILCLDEYNRNYAAKLIAIMQKHPDPVAGVEKMLAATAKQFQDPTFPTGCLAITGLLEVIGKSPKIDDHIRVVQKAFLETFEDYFRARPHPTGVSAKQLAQYVVGQLYALAVFSRTSKELFDFKGFVKLVRTSLEGFYGSA